MRFAFLYIAVVTAAAAERADWLLRYQKETKKFEVNQKALLSISALPPPITVISAIGDARVGKSTTLNFVRHIWETQERGKSEIEEVFATGDTTQPVTKGIWISAYKRDGKNVVLLDVEGVNLGDDAVTDHLSIFTTLLSSGIGLFCSGNINNHILDFLYRLPRLHSEVFEKHEVADGREKFGPLHVAIRGALEPPEGQTLAEFVRNAIFLPTGEHEGNDKKRETINTHFDWRDVSVSSIPEIPGGKLFKDISRAKENKAFWKSMKTIVDNFENFPEKTTLRKVPIDGSGMTQLLRDLVRRINQKSWVEFDDTYRATETSICLRNYDQIIAPVLKKTASSSEISEDRIRVMKEFKRWCPLDDVVDRAQHELMEYAAKRRREEEWWDLLVKAAYCLAILFFVYVCSQLGVHQRLVQLLLLSLHKAYEITSRFMCRIREVLSATRGQRTRDSEPLQAQNTRGSEPPHVQKSEVLSATRGQCTRGFYPSLRSIRPRSKIELEHEPAVIGWASRWRNATTKPSHLSQGTDAFDVD